MGGLVRRASLFETLRNDPTMGTKTLFIAGGYELLPLTPAQQQSTDLPHALAQAYTTLNYHTLYSTPDEKKFLRTAAAIPAQRIAGSTVDSDVFVLEGGVRIGIVYLPWLGMASRAVPSSLAESVRQTVLGLRKQTQLVTGLSTWGEKLERQYLTQYPGLFDIMLGSGPGPGKLWHMTGEGKTYWARAYTKGQAIHFITVKQWPQRRADWKWEKDISLSATMKRLDSTLDDNPAMRTLLEAYTLPVAE